MLYIILEVIFIITLLIIFTYSMTEKSEHKGRIAVYLGTFNPLHIGHKTIIDIISNKFDWIYLIITPQFPLNDETTPSSKERSDNAYDTVIKCGYYNVTVYDIENDMLPPYHTVTTLKKMKHNNNNANFTLVIGADDFTHIEKLKDYQTILSEFGVIVFPRGEEDVEYLELKKKELLLENPEYKITIEHIMTPNISSTEIRNAIKNGNNVEHLLM